MTFWLFMDKHWIVGWGGVVLLAFVALHVLGDVLKAFAQIVQIKVNRSVTVQREERPNAASSWTRLAD